MSYAFQLIFFAFKASAQFFFFFILEVIEYSHHKNKG